MSSAPIEPMPVEPVEQATKTEQGAKEELLDVIPQLGLAPCAIWQCPKCHAAAQSLDRRLLEKLQRPGDFVLLACTCRAKLKIKIPLIHHPKFQPQITRKQ